MPSLKDELVALIDGSLSITALSDNDQKAVKERLLALPKEEMEKAVTVLRNEQQEQYQQMKGLVDKIEEASRNLKKTFMKEREKHESAESEKNADALMDKLNNI